MKKAAIGLLLMAVFSSSGYAEVLIVANNRSLLVFMETNAALQSVL